MKKMNAQNSEKKLVHTLHTQSEHTHTHTHTHTLAVYDSTKKHQTYFDILNVLASFFVVLTHTPLGIGEDQWSISWQINRFFGCFSEIAVPIFFMISGATLLEYRRFYSTKTYIIKRVKRTVIPFIFWNVSFLIYNNITGIYKTESKKTIIESLLTVSHIPVYWFFPVLFSFYLLIIFIAPFSFEIINGRKYLKLLAFVLVVFYFLTNTLYGVNIQSAFEIPFTEIHYTIFLILGYLLHTSDFSKLKHFNIIVFFSWITSLLTLFVLYNISFDFLRIGGFIIESKGFIIESNIMIFAFLTFICAKTFFNKLHNEKSMITRIFKKLTKYTFGIYLIHILVMSIFFNFILTGIYFTGKYKLFFAFIIYISSLLLVYIFSKIPFLRRVV